MAELLLDIEMDRTSLQQIAMRFGEASNVVKEAAAWLGEKVSRLKFSDAGVIGFGTFETLEFLQWGIGGKAALWRALEVASGSDDRLKATDFTFLISRAEHQVERVEQQRLELRNTSFGQTRRLLNCRGQCLQSATRTLR